jgi:hypothetical protein
MLVRDPIQNFADFRNPSPARTFPPETLPFIVSHCSAFCPCRTPFARPLRYSASLLFYVPSYPQPTRAASCIARKCMYGFMNRRDGDKISGRARCIARLWVSSTARVTQRPRTAFRLRDTE